ncbi:MAG: hypothetical protein PHG15_12895 [Acinetobacter sp.]|nr:hypothetical protein [Acinetobacter sp.]MDD2946655.1 hypothetical protein [Acinetobacter sp.]
MLYEQSDRIKCQPIFKIAPAVQTVLIMLITLIRKPGTKLQNH